jgi:hypothetical protein
MRDGSERRRFVSIQITRCMTSIGNEVLCQVKRELQLNTSRSGKRQVDSPFDHIVPEHSHSLNT